jgi:two-component system phosphate regulon sensor histidine kinase PhoR
VYAFRDVTDERRLDEEKSDFIATISHELRTPMAAVYGAAETLLRRAVDLEEAQARQLLEMIASQAARLSHITEEVLLASRLDRGELALGRERVEIAHLVQRAVEVTCADDEAPQLDVAVPEGLAASGDADRIQQVLVNLLDNAVKYGGGAPVEVRAEGTEGAVRIAVSDFGPGIPAGDRDRVFEKFYRGDPNLTRSPGGTGLGLYISRELVRRMGGSLDLEPRDGAGARFVVELPAAS